MCLDIYKKTQGNHSCVFFAYSPMDGYPNTAVVDRQIMSMSLTLNADHRSCFGKSHAGEHHLYLCFIGIAQHNSAALVDE